MESLSGTTFRTEATPVLWCAARSTDPATAQGTAYLIDSVADIELDWLAGAGTVGLTAGASAPPALVDDVIDALRGLGPVTVTECRVAEESMRFSLPKAVQEVGT